MKYLFLLGCVVASPALAQEAGEGSADQIVLTEPVPEQFLTVLGIGTKQAVWSTAQPVSVIDADELASVQGADLTRALERLPGVTFSRNGGLGSATSLFVRGANSQQVLVLVDGVRMADVAAPSGGFDFGTLLAGGIGKVELLRGSNSVVWGSDAIGGVLAVTSDTAPGVGASLEYGADDTLSAAANAGISGERYRLAVGGGYTRTDGISAFSGGIEPDPFRQWHFSGTGRYDLSERVAVKLTGRYADSRVAYDGYPAPFYSFADTGEYQLTRQGSGRAGLAWYGDSVTLDAGLALSDTRRAYYDPAFGTAPGFETAGRSWRADVKGSADLAPGWQLVFGADGEWTRFATTYDPQRTARLLGGHGLLRYSGDRWQAAAGARIDDHDRFGSRVTFGGDAAVNLGDSWRLRASYGEGFKAPTLYQLYGYGGNAALKPEQSRSFDAAIERGNRNSATHLALTLFRRDSRDLIDYRSPTGYFNTARARAEGFEVELGVRPAETLSAFATYSYVRATDRTTRKDLARRPRHALTVGTEWVTPLAGLALGADLRLVSDSFDDAGNFARLDGYALVTLRASVPVNEQVELFGRVENVADVSYQTALGYGTPGRSAYAGVRARF